MNFQNAITTFQQFWQKKLPHEKKIWTIIFLLVIVSTIYLIAYEPAIRNIKHLEKAYPELKLQSATMSLMSDEYQLMTSALAENVTPITREIVEASLLRKGMKSQSLSVSNEIVRVQVDKAAYSAMMEWMFEMQKASRLFAEEVKITSMNEPGQVSFALTLKQQIVKP